VDSADLVLAKNGLATYCKENGIEHAPFINLNDVAAHVDQWVVSRTFLKDDLEERASA
jgi:2-hydroxy-3-keto-5-methylthiopentenyl-1-phosphate phosphatase